ncbi:NUDIX domain-containing protein [Thalassospira profundimaris]|uniref:NUDIX domain-containing protein n=1 Tax=Thalassospira profundimaris TaxID=502049 RepID=UPI000DED6360|nr:NUDIX domain-containing protein [Thalassospira profundimaris]
MKRLITLLRHGEAVTYDARGDFYRPLTEDGKLNIQRIGAFLEKQGFYPDLILASPAERSRHSAEKLHKILFPAQKPVITQDRRLYNADAATLRNILQNLSDDVRHVVLVGHNPGISALPALVAGADIRKKRLFPSLKPAAMIMIEITGNWSEVGAVSGRILQQVEPSQVPQDFPWPDKDGTEWRKRPPYFYRQSSVIPFRLIPNKDKGENIEILMALSSSGKHYVVPKGAIDPGMSAIESAQKEAREEAGCIGIALEPAIGSYHYQKWDARCDVEVFALKVTELLPEADWEESHRGRKWVPLAHAIEIVREDGLRKILKTFATKLANQS